MKSVDSILKRKKVDPVVVSVFKNVDAIREREFKKALTILGNKLGSEESRIIEQLSYAIVEGIISTPMNNLKTEIEIGDEDEEKIMNVVARLFKYKEQ
jgi:glutamyl-tRNA reductase